MIILGLITTISILSTLMMLYIFDKRISDLEQLFWENWDKKKYEK